MNNKTINNNKLLDIKDGLKLKPISGWLLGSEFKLVRSRTNLQSKLIDCITDSTPEGTVYIRLPKDNINSDKEVYMVAVYENDTLTSRKIHVHCGSYDIRVLDLEIVEMYTRYVKSKSEVNIKSRNCEEMSPRDFVFKRYEAICGLTSSMKVLLTKSMIGEDTSMDISEYTPIGRKFIPNVNRSRVGKLQHSLIYLTNEGLTLTRPDSGYLKIDVRYDKDVLKVYVIDSIGHVVLFDGEDKYVNNSFTAKVMKLLIECPLVASDKVMKLSQEDIIEVAEYVHNKSMIILNSGRMTTDYIKEVSKFLYRLDTRNFMDLYSIFSKYGINSKIDKLVTDKSYYIDKLASRYNHLGLDITK